MRATTGKAFWQGHIPVGRISHQLAAKQVLKS